MLKNKFVIILIVSLLLGWQLLRPGYYSMHDDLQVMRLYQMDRCFKDGQLPCRWAPDMAQNYGQPLFNFYSAFPYYLGELVHLLGFSLIDTVKILFLLALFLSGVFSYLLARQLMKNEWVALVSAIAYLTAPYHAVDIFVRGALSESWGLALVPLVLYIIVRLCREPKTSHAVLLAVSLAALLTTHNITVLISAPLFIAFGLYFFFTNPNRLRQVCYLASAILLGAGLAAFFLLPVLFEQAYIQTKFLTSDYFDFRAHFVTLGQLFAKLGWGYGPSRFNSFQYPETMSFFVGLVHTLALLAAPASLYLQRKNKHLFFLVLITFIFGLFYLFMTHSRSVFIWQLFPTLQFVQFPWRFLGPASLFTALLLGFLTQQGIKLYPGSEPVITAVLVAFLVGANFNYFRFEKYYPNLTDAVKLSGEEYGRQIKGALLDYLPKTARLIPETKAPSLPTILSGRLDINYFDKRSNYFASEFDVYDDTGLVQFPVAFFPGWTLYQNRAGSPIAFDIDNDFGLITVKLTKGHHLIQGFFEDTPVRRFANLSTFVSAFLLTLWFIISNQKQT